MRNFFTIDPGAEVGWAFFRGTKLHDAGSIIPRDGPWLDRMEDIGHGIDGIIRLHATTNVIIEYPSYFQSSGGQTTADSGALVKLAAAFGVILGRFHKSGRHPDLILVNDWKGQLKKDLVKERILQCLTADELNHVIKEKRSHAWDAVGIGLYLTGRAFKS